MCFDSIFGNNMDHFLHKNIRPRMTIIKQIIYTQKFKKNRNGYTKPILSEVISLIGF